MNRNTEKNILIFNDKLDTDSSNLLKLKNKYLDLSNKTLIMGILNVTPDSFYDGGVYKTTDDFLFRIEEMIDQGADIIDIGAESTRPGAEHISETEELERLIPVLEKAVSRIETIYSVDTTKSLVAKNALGIGVSIINDISGLSFDENLGKVVAEYDAGIVLMHTSGHPDKMQDNTEYDSLVNDINASLHRSLEKAVDCGINLECIIVDPGIGFGKTLEQNLEIIRRLSEFSVHHRPIMLGTSRKSFIGKLLGNLDVNKRLEGTAATVAASIMNGAKIVRVHDVREMCMVTKMIDAIKNKN